MTKRTRTVLFIIFVFLFLSLTPSVIFYSQGYRINFEEKKVVRTGAFYFKASPGRTEVYLNGKLKNRTSMLANSILIENLLPKFYEIEIKKDDYYPWRKTLEIKEKEVTEAKNIILFPKNPQFTVINQKFPAMTVSATSSDKNKVIESNGYEIWVNLAGKSASANAGADKIFLTRFSEKIGGIFWLNDYYLIFNVGDKIKIAEIDHRDRPNIIDFAEFKNPEILWDTAAKKLYVLSEKKLYLLENLLP